MSKTRKRKFLLIQVGRIMQDARERAGFTGRDVMEEGHINDAGQLSRLENGYGVTLTLKAIGYLCDFYRMPPNDKYMVQAMYQKAKDEDDPEWLEPYSQVLFRDISLLFYLERDASRLRIYDILAHGLFQTETYARMLHKSDKPAVAEKKIELRMQRQHDFWGRRKARQVELLVPEHALLGECPPEQIDHLIAQDELPGVTVKYLPAALGPRENLPGKFTVIEFDTGDPSVVYSESISGARYEHRKVAVEDHVAAFGVEFDEARTIKEFPRG